MTYANSVSQLQRSNKQFDLKESWKGFFNHPESLSYVDKYNKQAFHFVKKKFFKVDPTVISVDLLTMKINIIVREEITKGNRSIDGVVNHIQGDDYLFSNIQRRLETIKSLLEEFAEANQKRTPQMTTLYTNLNQLLASKILRVFFNSVENIRKSCDAKSKKSWKLIKLAFKDDKGNSNHIIKLLQGWLAPSSEHTEIIREQQLFEKKLNTLQTVQIPWKESNGAAFPIDNIPVEDVIRSIFPDDRVLMESIIINKMIYHCPEKSIDHATQELFFFDFMKALYDAGFAEKAAAEIDQDLAHFMGAKTLSKMECSAYFTSSPLPILNLLRPNTMNCWGHADYLLRQYFSGLFNYPYCAKLQQGTDCSFAIENSSNFSVTIKKSYAIYSALDTAGPHLRPDSKQKLCTITADWDVSKNLKGWKGNLTISDLEWETDTHERAQKEVINTVIPWDC